MAYEEYRRCIILAFPDIQTGPSLDLMAGSLAGGTTVIVTYPLDLVRTKLAYQVQRLSASNSGDMKGTMQSLVMIVQNQGWKQLFSGLSINYLRVVPSVAIGFTVYDTMKLWLRVPPRDSSRSATKQS